MKKKSKILAAAIAIMTLSTAASITGTVAWFTASNVVSVSGMGVEAQAEEGIVIANEDKSTWKTSALAKYDGASAKLVPTSTANADDWYHAFSDDANSAAHSGAYTTLNETVTSGIASATIDGNAKDIYLVNKFYLQCSGATALSNQDIYVKNVALTSAASQELSKSLRVLFQGDETVICAPVSGATTSYTVNGATAVTAEAGIGDVETKIVASQVNLPAYTAAGTGAQEIKVFVYFEGEDASCKSANIEATLEHLNLTFEFGNKAHA